MQLGKICSLLLKRVKKCACHTFLYIKKYFFPCLPRLHKITEMGMAFLFTKAMPYKILILEKGLKTHLNFLSKVHSVFHTTYFRRIICYTQLFLWPKSIVSMNQKFYIIYCRHKEVVKY